MISEETREKLRKSHIGPPRYWKGKHLSDEHKRKVSIGKRGCVSPNKGKRLDEEHRIKAVLNLNPYYWKGKHLSEEHKKKIGLVHKGTHLSKEHREKIGTSQKGRIVNEDTKQKLRLANIGKHHTENTRKKMSLAHKGVPLGEKHRLNIRLANQKNGFLRRGKPGWNKGKHGVYSKETLLKKSIAGKRYRASPETKKKLSIARTNRVFPFKDTIIECLLQDEISSRGYAYYKHYPIIGQPDIAFPNQKIAIFADGDYWHNLPHVKERGKYVSESLKNQGWLVLRYWEHEIKSNPIGVVDEIEDCLMRRVV